MPKVKVPKTERIRRLQQCKSMKGVLLLARARARVSSSTVESDKSPELWITAAYIQGVLCFSNRVAGIKWLAKQYAHAWILNLASHLDWLKLGAGGDSSEWPGGAVFRSHHDSGFFVLGPMRFVKPVLVKVRSQQWQSSNDCIIYYLNQDPFKSERFAINDYAEIIGIKWSWLDANWNM